jgi:phosphate-selective porin
VGQVGLVGCLVLVFASSAAAQASAQTAERAREGAFTWTPTGHVQFDLRSFADWDLPAETARLQRSDLEVRRARVGFDASWRQMRFEFSVDPLDEDGTWLKDARVEMRPSRWLRVHGGQFKLPGGREYATSTRRLGFLERSPLSESLAAGRDLGAQVELRPPGPAQFELGLFAGDGWGRQDRSNVTFAGRGSVEPRRRVDLGGYFSIGRTRAGLDSDPANGINGRSPASFRFFDRLYVQGRRTRLGVDAQWVVGDWRVNGEAMRLRDERRQQAANFSDLPDLVADAATISLRWQPGRPELGVRYDWLAFDDAGPETGVESVRPRAADLRPRASHGITVTGGWQLAPWLRVIADVSRERYTDPRTAPMAGRAGPYITLAARLQIERP